MNKRHLAKARWGSWVTRSGPGYQETMYGKRIRPACGQQHGEVAAHPKDADCRKCLKYVEATP